MKALAATIESPSSMILPPETDQPTLRYLRFPAHEPGAVLPKRPGRRSDSAHGSASGNDGPDALPPGEAALTARPRAPRGTGIGCPSPCTLALVIEAVEAVATHDGEKISNIGRAPRGVAQQPRRKQLPG